MHIYPELYRRWASFDTCLKKSEGTLSCCAARCAPVDLEDVSLPFLTPEPNLGEMDPISIDPTELPPKNWKLL